MKIDIDSLIWTSMEGEVDQYFELGESTLTSWFSGRILAKGMTVRIDFAGSDEGFATEGRIVFGVNWLT